jgi:hypothetical protein
MKKGNPVGSQTFSITLSTESVRLLDEIAKNGIWGRNRPEVAARFIDRALEAFVEQPRAKLPAIKLKSPSE